MRIDLHLFIGSEHKTQQLHEDYAGVTTYEKQHGGEFRVAEITAVTIGYDGILNIWAKPLSRDLPPPVEEAAPEPMPVALKAVDEVF